MSARPHFALFVLLALCSALVCVTRVARAHDPFEVTTAAALHANALELEVTMTEKAAGRLAAASAAPRDLAALSPELYAVDAAGTKLRVLGSNVTRAEGEVTFRVTYEHPRAAALRLHATHLERLGEGYTSALEFSRDDSPRSRSFHVLTTADSTRTFDVAAAASSTPTAQGTLGSFFVLGVQHLLEGYDHLLFLAGVLMAASSWRKAFRLVTAFTLAHSLTLALALLGWLALPGALVEAAIAASIVVVGVENLWLRDEPRHRVLIVFAFGLVHGLGFAGALQRAGLGESTRTLATSLFAFNAGIEVAQLALAVLLLPLLAKARAGRLGARSLGLASLAISLVGAYLLVDRSLLS